MRQDSKSTNRLTILISTLGYTEGNRSLQAAVGCLFLPLSLAWVGGWGVVCGSCGCGWVVVRRSVVTGGVGRVAPVSQASRAALPPRRLTVVSAVGPRYAYVPSPSSSSVSRALHVRALLRTAAMPSSPAGVSRTSPLHFAAHAALVSTRPMAAAPPSVIHSSWFLIHQ